ncbi:hypothetical protein [Agaribacterium sp. ZY112]|uniref:hypothetical protein n=1 Tax=Agaribacterium sp. ZY112 TaxID=3233574 RepID=UPI003524C570
MLDDDIATLLSEYEGLEEIKRSPFGVTLAGMLSFDAAPDSHELISDCFEIEVFIPSEYPEKMPLVWDAGARIRGDFEHINSDGSFCLAVPVEERIIFDQSPSLLGFIDNLVVPFLYGYSYWEKNAEMPFDERSHGAKGLLEYYLDLYSSSDKVAVLKGVYGLVKVGYKPHEKCPCGSGRKVLRCHKEQSKAIAKSQYKEKIAAEMYLILDDLTKRSY